MIRRKVIKPGDPADAFGAGDYQAIAREVERLEKLAVAPPLELRTGPTGRVLSGSIAPAPLLAQLEGSESPYRWAELKAAEGQGWTVQGRTSAGESTAYEVNERPGLDTKIVELVEVTPTDFRFQFIRKGQGGLKIHVTRPCNAQPSPGDSVSLRLGSTVLNRTTDANGDAFFGDVAAGTYTASVPAPRTDFAPLAGTPRWNAINTSVVVTGSPDQSVTIGHALNSTDYVCIGTCSKPVCRLLVVTDSVYGPATLGQTLIQWVPARNQWEADVNVSVLYPGCGGCAAYPGPLQPISYRLGVGPAFAFTANIRASSAVTCCPAGAGAIIAACAVQATLTSYQCDPFELHYQGATHPSLSIEHVYCSDPTITITE